MKAIFALVVLLLCVAAVVLAEDYYGEDQMWVEARGRTGPGKVFLSFNATNVDHFKRAYSLSLSPSSGASGASFTATYSADDVTSTWIGIFASGSTTTSTFKYVTASSGSVVFSTSGLSAGSYNVYLVISTGYVKASATYTVTSGSSTTTTTTTGSTTGTTPAGDPTTWLAAHNAKRATYGVPDLAWSTNLQSTAQSYANTLASGCTFAHSGGSYGENLAMGYVSIQAVLNAWVDTEAQFYDSSAKACSGGVCGHFTQVLWRMTSYVGCGIASCSSGTPIYVCQYLRPGNCNGYDYQSTSSPCGPLGP